MIVDRVEAIPFRIPLKSKVSFASGSLTSLDHVLVRVTSRDGVDGTAEAPARPMVYGESSASIVHAVNEWFGPAIVGLDARDQDARDARFGRVEHNSTAKGAVDIACHDLVARTLGLSMRHLLGGFADSVQVSHILGIGDPEAVAEDAIRLREQHGIGTFKLKAGIDPVRDTELIRVVRRRLGDQVRLTVDCNHGYDPQTAAVTIPAWEEHGIAWVEEPCPGQTAAGVAALALRTRLPLMADESADEVADVATKLGEGNYRFFCVKTARGGYSRNRRIVTLCEAVGAATVVGSQGDTDLGTLTSAQFSAAFSPARHYPAELTFFLEAEGGILTEPPAIVDGALRLPDGPGHGGTIDEDRLARFRIG